MKTSTTLLLAAAATGLFFAIRWYESGTPSTREAALLERQVVVFNPEGVDGIDIVNNEEKIKLRRKGTVWELREPVKDRADQAVVGEIIGWAQMLQKEETFPAKEVNKKQLKRFGLSKPGLKLKLRGEKTPPEFLFGKEAAVEGRSYLRLDDSREVYVTANALRNLITRKVDELRDPRLSDLDARQVHRLAIRTAAGEIELEKEAGHWRLTKPLKARAHNGVVEELLGTLVAMPVVGFESARGENLNRYGLGDPAETIRLWAGDEEAEPVVLAVGREVSKAPESPEAPDAPKGAGRYARISTRDVVLTLPAAVTRMLALRPSELRDRSLVRVEFDMVDRITLQAAGQPPLVLQRRLEEWTLRAGSGEVRPANRAKVEALAKALRDREVSAFVADVAPDLAKYGLEEPSLKVTLSAYASENTAESGAGELPIVEILFGATEGDTVYAKLAEEPFVVAVPRELLEAFRPEPVLWRSLSVLSVPVQSVVALERREAEKPPVVITRSEAGWVAGAEGATVETLNLESVLNTFARLHALRWEEGGLETVEWQFSLRTDAGETHRLQIGPADAEGTRHAVLDGGSGRFELSRPDAAALLLPLERRD